MIKKLSAFVFFCALTLAFNLPTFANSFSPSARNEKFAVRTLQTLHSAEVTYQATSGNGNFGSLSDLLQANLIDAATASGDKYGYRFAVQTTTMNGTTPASYFATATPQRYGKTGRKSFYIAASGVIRGADKQGAPADANDPIIENVCLPNEECTISNVRTLHSAEVTYSATYGNGNYTNFAQLFAVGLISSRLATGSTNGYYFTVNYVDRTPTSEATFNISAVPITYGATGVRSFYIATDGVIHAADRQGAPATAGDPVIEY